MRVQANNLTPAKCVTVSILRQDQTPLVTSGFLCSTTFNFPATPQTLPATETYYVKIDPKDMNTGTFSVKVTSP